MAVAELGLVQDQDKRLILARQPAHDLAGKGRHHRIPIDQRVHQHPRDPLIAHVDAVGVAGQTRGQVHPIGTAHIQHRRHQQRQIGPLGLPLLGQKSAKFLGYPFSQASDAVHDPNPLKIGRTLSITRRFRTSIGLRRNLMDGEACHPSVSDRSGLTAGVGV
jgi:hypothetical protein